MRRWVILAGIIGVVSGLAAIAFATLLELATHLFLGTLAGVAEISAFGEGNIQGPYGVLRPWAVPLIVGLGGLISGILVFKLAPEAEGHGTDAAISAVHHDPTGIRLRVSLVKMVASAVTIGSGGSGGREGPTAQISAGFSSWFARILDLTPADARIAVTVGIASGIGAIFRAPLGGAVLGAEILYREDFEGAALVPSAIASVIAFSIFGAVKGFTPIFGFLHGYHFQHPAEMLFYLLIGVLGGLLGRLYAGGFYGIAHMFTKMPGSRMIKPALAGVAVGCIGLVIPGALGTGYGWVQKAMGPALLAIPLWIVLALPFAKILSTSLSIGSGGSGGIFGPGMVIGGFLGAGVWRLLEPLAPGIVPHSPAPFVIVGMVACFGSIAHAPIAVLLMVAEMTGSLELLPAALVAVAVATLVVGAKTIYTSQLKNRAEAPASRLRAGLPLLSAISITDGLSPPPVILTEASTTDEAIASMTRSGLDEAPVVGPDGRFVGVFRLTAERRSEEGPVARHITGIYPVLPQDATLAAAADAFASDGVTWVPVLDADRGLLGVVTVASFVDAYRESLNHSVGTLQEVLGDVRLISGRVPEGSMVEGKAVDSFPHSAAVVAVERDGVIMIPHAGLTLEAGDDLTILVTASAASELAGSLAAGPEPSGEEPLI